MSEITVGKRRMSSIGVVDAMTPSIKECVHDFGLPIVSALTKHGVTNPQHIREVVREIWAGPRQEGQGNNSMDALDTLLSHGIINTNSLLRFLKDNNLAIVSCEPTREMLNASMGEVSDFTVRCTKEEKHRRRLRAAIRAGMK